MTDLSPAASPDPGGGPGPDPAVTPAVIGWGIQTGLFQHRQPAFWLVAVLFVITGGSVIGNQLTLIEIVPTAWFLSWGLLLVYAVPVALVIYRVDLFEREPLSLVLAALAWGGIVAIQFAGITNDAWFEILHKVAGPQLTSEWGAALIAPPVEESLKAFGVIAIVLIARREVDDILDGFVYGALVGLGFTVVEDVHYFIQFVADAGGVADQVEPVLHGFFIRVIASGLYGHVLYTGVAGIGIAYAATRTHLPAARRYGVAGLAFVAAMAGHAFWNSPLLGDALLGNDPGPVDWIVYAAAKGLPFLGFVVVLVRLASAREHATFAALVEVDPAGEIVTAAEMAALGGLFSRRAARKAAARRHGPAAERIVGALQHEQIRYGLTRARTGSADNPAALAHVDRIRALRAQLAALPAGGAVAAVGTAATAPATTPDSPAAAPASAPPRPPVAAAWQPTHRVPAGGLPAWDLPDPARPPMVTLAERLDLVVVERAGDWARVRAVNGWLGWVDGRRIVPGPPPD